MKIIKILNYIFPLIIGALCSYMGSLTHIGKNNILQIIICLLYTSDAADE